MRAFVKCVIASLFVVAPAHVALSSEVVSTQEIAFGAIVPGPSGGTITITPAGSRSCSVGLTCLPQSVAHAARFTISGDPFMSFVITLPATAALTGDGGNSMTVDGFDSSLAGDSGTLGSTGRASFSVGATLHVGPVQPTAAYSGAFNVMVAYQ